MFLVNPGQYIRGVRWRDFKPGELKEIYSNRLRSNAMSSIRQLNIGYNVPKFHTSPVAVLAYAIEQHIQNKAVPANLAENQKGAEPEQKAPANMVEAGRECHECGAHAVVRRDGCEKCTNCGMLGSCG